jgi:hypothetical protein
MTTTLLQPTDEQIEAIAERMASTLSASGGLRAFARAVLAAQPAPVPAPVPVPPGWKLVPVEPTDEMRRVGADVWHLHDGHLTRVIGDVYRAMLAASPEVPNA